MNRNIESRPVNSKLKKQTLFVLCVGLLLGSAMVFTVVWSGTHQHMEKKRLEALEKERKGTVK